MKFHVVNLHDIVFLEQDLSFPLHARNTLEISKQAALNPELRPGSLLNGNVEMPGWVIGADLILYIHDVLPLQKLCQADIKADGVGADIDA